MKADVSMKHEAQNVISNERNVKVSMKYFFSCSLL